MYSRELCWRLIKLGLPTCFRVHLPARITARRAPHKTSTSSSMRVPNNCAHSSARCQADLDSALEAHQRQSMFNVIDQATGWKIDLIIRKSRPYSQEEFRRRQRATLHGVAVFMTAAEAPAISNPQLPTPAPSASQF